VPRLELLVRHPLLQISFGVLAVALLQFNLLLLRTAAGLHWNDFGKFYYAVQSWRAGLSMYAPTPATDMAVGVARMQLLDMNPPHFHLLVLPLLPWEVQQAGMLWTAVNLTAALLAVALTIRETRARVHPSRILPVVCLALMSASTGANAVTAQCTGLLMLPTTAAWIAARGNRWTRCGLWLGVLISIKPFLGLFIPTLMLLRQWRALAALVLAAAACLAAGLLVFGRSAYQDWFAALRDVRWTWAAMNGSIMAIIARSADRSPVFTPVALLAPLVVPLWLACSAMVAALSLRATRRSVDHAFGVTVLASLLISPLGWVYYLWLAVPGCAALWRTRVPPMALGGLAILCIPVFATVTGQPHALATITIGSSYVWATLALWGASVVGGSAALATGAVTAGREKARASG